MLLQNVRLCNVQKEFLKPMVAILCGGKGERLREAVEDRPKSLALVNGRPFLDILIDFFFSQGFRDFLLLTGYLAPMIEEYAIEKQKKSPIRIFCVTETSPLDTGGALKNAEAHICSENIIVANGDSICMVDLEKLIGFHYEKDAVITMLLATSAQDKEYGNVVIANDGSVVSFQEKVAHGVKGYVNAGIYMINKAVLKSIPPEKRYSLERELFPKFVGNGFYGYAVKREHVDIGTPERFQIAQNMNLAGE